MDLIKYDMTDVWAVAGDVVAPDSAKIRAGWGVEVVPRQWWNWFENRQDNNIAYMLQKGFPEWDATTEYIINKSYVQRNGIVYKATATSTNSDPVALTSWVRAFADYSVSNAALGALTPAANQMPYFTSTSAALTTLTAFARTLLDDADAATMRATLSAQTLNTNLTALSGVTAVTNGLPYFTSTTAMGVANFTAFARTLLDDADAATARVTLGLKGGAITDITANSTDSTAGRLMQTGDFGLGTAAAPVVTDANAVASSGFYYVNSTAANLPIVSNGSLQHFPFQDGSAAMQLFSTLSSPARLFQRTKASNAWLPWKEIWTTENLVKTTSIQDTTVGRMLKVGDFGFGKDSVTITDPDTVYRGSGFYDVNSSTTWANRPIAGWTRIFHQSHANASGYATQIATGDFTNTAVRMFYRTTSGNGVWTSWVEMYHSGNTSAIVSQVQAGIQPTLDAKVSKAGDTMTGTLVVPSIELGQGSNAGYLDLHGASSSTDFDARITVDSNSATNGAGRLTVTAGSMYASIASLTVTGSGNFQGALSTSGLLTAASANINGALAVSGTATLAAANITGTLSVAGQANLSGGTAGGITTASGVLNIYPAGNNNSGNAHIWYRNTDGGTRGIVYASSAGTIAIQPGASTVAANFYAAGNAGFNNITTGTIGASGRITGTDCVFSGNVYSGSGNSFLQNDGNVYGGTWGGYLSTWINNNFLSASGFRNNLANVRAGELGSYALLQHPGGANIGPNGSVAGTDMSWATAAGGFDERVGSGTWVVMGRISTGNKPVATTLCMRYA